MNIIKLALSIALPLVIGAVAGIFTTREIPEWYATLNRPGISPPNWIFGPVWTILYILMGFSFYLIWIQPAGNLRTLAIVIYLLQLLLNFSWSFLFFYFKRIGFSLIEIIFLWLSILIMLFFFYRVKPAAAYLNIPYFLWVSFASVLNASYFSLN
ncbi:MAG: TspO/MBR family protein [Bacteroidales bacterium]|jgi:tryptophan-rich sensory protein